MCPTERLEPLATEQEEQSLERRIDIQWQQGDEPRSSSQQRMLDDDPDGEEEKKGNGCRNFFIKLAIAIAIIVTIVVCFHVFGLRNELNELLEWIDRNRIPGGFVFATIYIIATVLFIPGSILSLAAGAIFGWGVGFLVTWIGAVVGETTAFLVGRYLFRDAIANYATKYRIWRAIEIAVEEQGLKIVTLLRLAPILPFNALNYLLGISSVQFWPYFIASTLGIIPGTALYVYVGSAARNLADVLSGDSGPPRTVSVVVGVVSGVVILAVVVMTTIYAKRALRRYLPGDEEAAAADVESTGINGSDVEGAVAEAAEETVDEAAGVDSADVITPDVDNSGVQASGAEAGEQLPGS